MNIYKVMGPDTALGRMFLRGRAEVDLLRLRRSDGEAGPAFTRLARRLVPKYTMVSIRRLQSLYALGCTLNQRAVPGAVVECGVWNGGSSAMIAGGLAVEKDAPGRPFWLFDSFAGLPEPTEEDDTRVKQDYFPGWCTGAVERVRQAHRLAGHDEENVTIIPGWFEETLATHGSAIGPIALLHIDADWYASVQVVLETFYPQVVSGGIVVIDDYGSWSGCRKAVHAYFGDIGLEALALEPVDGNAVYFYKP